MHVGCCEDQQPRKVLSERRMEVNYFMTACQRATKSFHFCVTDMARSSDPKKHLEILHVEPGLEKNSPSLWQNPDFDVTPRCLR